MTWKEAELLVTFAMIVGIFFFPARVAAIRKDVSWKSLVVVLTAVLIPLAIYPIAFLNTPSPAHALLKGGAYLAAWYFAMKAYECSRKGFRFPELLYMFGMLAMALYIVVWLI